MTDQRSNSKSPDRHRETSHHFDRHESILALDTLNSFDEEHDDR